MNRHLPVILAALLLLGLAPPAAAQVAMPPGWQADMVEVVVELESDESVATYTSYFLSRLNVPEAEFSERVNHVYTHTITGFSVYLSPQELETAERLFTPGELGVQVVLPAVPMSVPDLSHFGITGAIQGNNLRGDGLIVPTGLMRIEAPLPETPGTYANVDVAVIDTGIDSGHGQLNVAGGVDCTAEPDDRDSFGVDPYGHGTHVAGTIAATYAANGVVGVAPGARLWDVRVLDANGGGNMASIICGIDWVAGQGIPIANMSLGGQLPETECGGPDPMHNAICIASEDTTFVVAAGNAGTDAASHVPASYDEVVTVAAFADFDGRSGGGGLEPTDRCGSLSFDDELASFSNYGEDVDLSAPGVCILSTLPDGTYGYLSGTSMAAPHVAGAFARWLSVNPGDEQRAHASEVFTAWSARNGTADRYDGSHTDHPSPLLYIGDLPGPWSEQPEPEFQDPLSIQR